MGLAIVLNIQKIKKQSEQHDGLLLIQNSLIYSTEA